MAKKCRAKKRKSDIRPDEAPCELCGALVNKEHFTCRGCNAVICDPCDETQVMGFNHEPRDHKFEFGGREWGAR